MLEKGESEGHAVEQGGESRRGGRSRSGGHVRQAGWNNGASQTYEGIGEDAGELGGTSTPPEVRRGVLGICPLEASPQAAAQGSGSRGLAWPLGLRAGLESLRRDVQIRDRRGHAQAVLDPRLGV